jgi:recombination protein RecA
VKNKVAPPFKEAEFDIMYGQGISVEGDVLDLAVGAKIVQKSGAWFSYGDQRLGQGRENVRQFLRDNPELVQQLRGEIVQAVDADWAPASGKAQKEAPQEAIEESVRPEADDTASAAEAVDPE